MTIRVFHIPSHLAYVRKLEGRGFAPVFAPEGRPLRVRDLIDRQSWDFFDVIHLHTVELATKSELERLSDRCENEGKRLIFTVHDLHPNIETEQDAYRSKVKQVLGYAHAAFTLTHAAADSIDIAASMKVVPHGHAVSDAVWPTSPVWNADGPLVTFGALRTNRDLLTLLSAHWHLERDRPEMKVLLRSVNRRDEERDWEVLADLERTAQTDSRFHLTVTHDMVDEAGLVEWLTGASALVLPYRTVTHSGQLELARDLGLPVLAPDVRTLRAQLHTPHPVSWFNKHDFTTERFGTCLLEARHMRPPTDDEHRVHLHSRRAEHDRLVDAHARAYRSGTPDQ